MTNNQKTPTSGVGGWLWWLVAGMLVIGPLIGTFMLLGATFGQERLHPELAKSEQWKNFETWVWIAYLIFIGIQIHAGWAMARRRDPSAVALGKQALWVTGPVALIVIGIIVPAMTLGHWNAMIVPAIGQIIGSSIWAGIWTAYLNRSIRVRNTYGLGDPIAGKQVQADNITVRKAAATETAIPRHRSETITASGNIESSANIEDQIYAQIADELNSGNMDKATWTKAYAVSDGEDKKVRSVYIKLRFERLLASRDESQPTVEAELPQQEPPKPQISLENQIMEDELYTRKVRNYSIVIGLVIPVVFVIAALQPSTNKEAGTTSGSERESVANRSAAESPAPEFPALAPPVDAEPTMQPAPQNAETSQAKDRIPITPEQMKIKDNKMQTREQLLDMLNSLPTNIDNLSGTKSKSRKAGAQNTPDPNDPYAQNRIDAESRLGGNEGAQATLAASQAKYAAEEKAKNENGITNLLKKFGFGK